MIYLNLFWAFIQVGLFSIGGGMAAIPLIQSRVVEANQWLTLTEFTDLITIAQMTPGPIAVNSATFIGMRIAGLPGAIIATLGSIFPACIIVTLFAYIYNKHKGLSVIQAILAGLRPAIVALIAAAGIKILHIAVFGGSEINVASTSFNFIALFLFAGALLALRKWKFSPITVMVGSGIIGGTAYLLF